MVGVKKGDKGILAQEHERDTRRHTARTLPHPNSTIFAMQARFSYLFKMEGEMVSLPDCWKWSLPVFMFGFLFLLCRGARTDKKDDKEEKTILMTVAASEFKLPWWYFCLCSVDVKLCILQSFFKNNQHCLGEKGTAEIY